jgi:hypothetical protein
MPRLSRRELFRASGIAALGVVVKGIAIQAAEPPPPPASLVAIRPEGSVRIADQSTERYVYFRTEGFPEPDLPVTVRFPDGHKEGLRPPINPQTGIAYLYLGDTQYQDPRIAITARDLTGGARWEQENGTLWYVWPKRVTLEQLCGTALQLLLTNNGINLQNVGVRISTEISKELNEVLVYQGPMPNAFVINGVVVDITTGQQHPLRYDEGYKAVVRDLTGSYLASYTRFLEPKPCSTATPTATPTPEPTRTPTPTPTPRRIYLPLVTK